MTGNRDLDAVWKYHNGTKHSYQSLRNHPHFLDWDNKPLLFKIYPTLEVTRLPKDFRQSGVTALSAIASAVIKAKGEKVPTLEDVNTLIRLLARSATGQEISTYTSSNTDCGDGSGRARQPLL